MVHGRDTLEIDPIRLSYPTILSLHNVDLFSEDIQCCQIHMVVMLPDSLRDMSCMERFQYFILNKLYPTSLAFLLVDISQTFIINL
jgi:hypothetical protein